MLKGFSNSATVTFTEILHLYRNYTELRLQLHTAAVRVVGSVYLEAKLLNSLLCFANHDCIIVLEFTFFFVESLWKRTNQT